MKTERGRLRRLKKKEDCIIMKKDDSQNVRGLEHTERAKKNLKDRERQTDKRLYQHPLLDRPPTHRIPNQGEQHNHQQRTREVSAP